MTFALRIRICTDSKRRPKVTDYWGPKSQIIGARRHVINSDADADEGPKERGAAGRFGHESVPQRTLFPTQTRAQNTGESKASRSLPTFADAENGNETSEIHSVRRIRPRDGCPPSWDVIG